MDGYGPRDACRCEGGRRVEEWGSVAGNVKYVTENK